MNHVFVFCFFCFFFAENRSTFQEYAVKYNEFCFCFRLFQLFRLFGSRRRPAGALLDHRVPCFFRYFLTEPSSQSPPHRAFLTWPSSSIAFGIDIGIEIGFGIGIWLGIGVGIGIGMLCEEGLVRRKALWGGLCEEGGSMLHHHHHHHPTTPTTTNTTTPPHSQTTS